MTIGRPPEQLDLLGATEATAEPSKAEPSKAEPSKAEPLTTQPLTVEVIRSSKRRKTAQARMKGAVLEVRIPARMTKAEEREMVEHFRHKFERSRQATDLDLHSRTAQLCRIYDLPTPTSIQWVSNQAQRWGSCTPANGTIRISDRLAAFPEWVVDYVIVHELAHLLEYRHSPRFWMIVDRYPLSERARGFLMAKGSDEEA